MCLENKYIYLYMQKNSDNYYFYNKRKELLPVKIILASLFKY